MATIKCKNVNFCDSRHGVMFKDGVAKTNDPAAIEWFKSHGYEVISERNTEHSPNTGTTGNSKRRNNAT